MAEHETDGDGARAHRHPVRLPPLPTTDWDDAEYDAISVLPAEMQPPPGTEINALNAMAHHPTLSKAVLRWSLYLRFESTLTDRERELLILRTAWLNGAEYELLRHARLARRYGFTEDELVAVTIGSAASGWTRADSLLLVVAEELTRDRYVSDDTWQALLDEYSVQQVMDAMFVVGTYTMLAMAYGSMGVQPEDDLPPFPVAFD